MNTPNTAEQIVARFPIRNQRWMLTNDTFHADTSELEYDAAMAEGPIQDPWNRPVGSTQPVRDDENDITHWVGVTTVAGQNVKIKIFND